MGSDRRPLRVAIAGYGLAGSVFHAPLVASTPGLEVAAIVTADEARRRKAAADFPGATLFGSAQELWAQADGYDLAVIATPNREHVPQGIAALQAGLATVIDKPLAPSVAEAERLLEAAQRTGRPLTVFQNRRWDGDFLTLRRIAESELLGPLSRLESRFERFRPAVNTAAWREGGDPADAGGLLFDLGAHLIDQAMLLFGTPQEVYAETPRRRPGAAVDDDSFLALQFPGGATAHLTMSVIPRLAAPRFRAVGSRGVWEKMGLDPQEDALRRGGRPGDQGWGREGRERWGRASTEVGGLVVDGQIETLPGQYEAFYAGVRDALTADTAMPVDPVDALAVLRVIERALGR